MNWAANTTGGGANAGGLLCLAIVVALVVRACLNSRGGPR